MPRSRIITAVRYSCLFAWLVINTSAFTCILAEWTHPSPTILVLVVFFTPAYILTVHTLDRNLGLAGIRCLRHLLTSSDNSQDGKFRRNLRLEMLTITSGFAATLFFLSLQLYFDLDESTRPTIILQTMATLFFFASTLNLLQIVLYDFLLATSNKPDTLSQEVRRFLNKTLRIFKENSWNALIVPSILAFTLVNPLLCVAVNFLYGVLLYYYYFFNLSAEAIEECIELKEATSKGTSLADAQSPQLIKELNCATE